MVRPNVDSATGWVPPGRRGLIIVEDEPVARRALKRLMAAEGFAVRAYPSAEDAWAGVEAAGVPDVVLVDLNLPGMSGVEFIRRVERVRATVVPVLITAAGSDTLDLIRQDRPVLLCRKPLDLGRLVTMLEHRFTSN